MFTDKSEQKREQTIMEYHVGRDLKEHLVQPFLSKAQS